MRREGTFLWYSADTEALKELLVFLYAERPTRNKAIKPQKIVIRLHVRKGLTHEHTECEGSCPGEVWRGFPAR